MAHRFNLKFPDSLWTKLKEEAKRLELSVTEIIRRVLDSYFGIK